MHRQISTDKKIHLIILLSAIKLQYISVWLYKLKVQSIKIAAETPS